MRISLQMMEDPLASVCVFVLAQGAGPPTVLLCTVSVSQSVSHALHQNFLCQKEEKKNVLPGLRLCIFSLAPRYFSCQEGGSSETRLQTQTSESHQLLYAAHLQLSVRGKTGHVRESLQAGAVCYCGQ